MRMFQMRTVRADPGLPGSSVASVQDESSQAHPHLPWLARSSADFPLIRALVQALSNLVTDNFYIVAAILPGLVRTKFDSNVISSVLRTFLQPCRPRQGLTISCIESTAACWPRRTSRPSSRSSYSFATVSTRTQS